MPLRKGERLVFNQVVPPWQRPEVWSTAQKRSFVESVFMGLNCGVYVRNALDWDDHGRKPMSGWILDGQQRISALRDFIEGGMAVFGDVTFDGLSRPDAVRFLRRNFVCYELNYIGDEASLKSIYNHLSFGGTLHTDEQRA